MVLRHALKNALLPVITIIGIELLVLFGGLVVVETVFTIPGIGRFLVDAITHRDYPIDSSVSVCFLRLRTGDQSPRGHRLWRVGPTYPLCLRVLVRPVYELRHAK